MGQKGGSSGGLVIVLLCCVIGLAGLVMKRGSPTKPEDSAAKLLLEKVRVLEPALGVQIQQSAESSAAAATREAIALPAERLRELSLRAVKEAYHAKLDKSEYGQVFPDGRNWADYRDLFDGPEGVFSHWLDRIFLHVESASEGQAAKNKRMASLHEERERSGAGPNAHAEGHRARRSESDAGSDETGWHGTSAGHPDKQGHKAPTRNGDSALDEGGVLGSAH